MHWKEFFFGNEVKFVPFVSRNINASIEVTILRIEKFLKTSVINYGHPREFPLSLFAGSGGLCWFARNEIKSCFVCLPKLVIEILKLDLF